MTLRRLALLVFLGFGGCVSHNTYYVNIDPSFKADTKIGGVVEKITEKIERKLK